MTSKDIECSDKYTPTPPVQAWSDEVLALTTRVDAMDPQVQRAIRELNAKHLAKRALGMINPTLEGEAYHRSARTIENLLGEQS